MAQPAAPPSAGVTTRAEAGRRAPSARIPVSTRAWAASTDPGRLVIGGLVILASAFSLFATGYALRGARTCPVEGRSLFFALGLVAVGAAWFLTHTMYTLRYAHLYYRDGREREGVGEHRHRRDPNPILHRSSLSL